MSVLIVDNHHLTMESVLQNAFAQSREARFAVAFLKYSGIRIIEPWLDEFLQRQGNLEFLVGLDFYTTEGKALRFLLDKQQTSSGRCRLFCFSAPEDRVETYHPKLYLFKERRKIRAIIGSSNLTKGGLRDNVEINVVVEYSNLENEQAQALLDFYARLKFNETCFSPDDKYIDAYSDVADRIRRTRNPFKDKKVRVALDELRQQEKNLPSVRPSARELKGWQKLVYEKLPRGPFKTSDLYQYVALFQKAYPKNHRIEAKIRQILQQLRDMGLIEHLGHGYWKIRDWEDSDATTT